MVLIRPGLLGLLVVAGCGQSLFDAHGAVGGDGDGGTGGNNVPDSCPAPCLADAAANFDGTAGGAGNHWRYLDDHRNRSWAAMTAGAAGMAGADPGNHITTCAAHPDAAACAVLPGALLVSSAGATSAADPAIELTAPTSQVIQLSLRAVVPGGDPQTIRIYRNSREDVLFTTIAHAGTVVEQAVTLDALQGDRFLVAVAPVAGGATDVALHLFANATGAAFPSTCRIALPFTAATGNTVHNLCGHDFTHTLEDAQSNNITPTPPSLMAGPYPELGTAADFTASTDYEGTDIVDRSSDTTIQFWAQVRSFVPSYNAWLYSDLDLDTPTGGGLGIVVIEGPPVRLDVTTCTSSTASDNTFNDNYATYPTDGSWQFLRVVQAGGDLRVCMNGTRVAGSSVGAGKLRSQFSPYLGRNVTWLPEGAYLNGKLDDLRVITGALPCE